MKRLLVTGGSGFIGSHTVVELIQKGYEVVIFDNLTNSSPVVLDRISKITKMPVEFVKGDLRDKCIVNDVFEKYNFDAVLHFAGLKAVEESVQEPMRYYDNNVFGTLQLLDVMERHDIKKLVFSSSATVYGCGKELPFREDMELGIPSNPYGMTKLVIEKILSDMQKADDTWRIMCLRYFNPVGAHPSGLIGEDQRGVPNNLMPFLTQTALGKREYLNIFGGDYPTPDGTAIRDFIHVVDLAKAHVCALQKCNETRGCNIVNIGKGKGYSVLEVLRAFEKTSNLKIPFKVVEKRVGDVAISVADTRLAESFLSWRASLSLDDMCKHSWNWQSKNPEGYSEQKIV
ncbi:UDP-glucose 4-epimerase GalE [Alphaproteobacteria bacterium]|nr:UDP-glucose 4-epimerase GalE [Alphaproteobacteria bacterium]